MKQFKALFKKDIITVLIVSVALMLVAAFVAILYLIFRTPSGASITSELFPTQTLQFKVILTNVAATREAMAAATPEPTITTIPFTPNASVLTLTPDLSATPELQTTLQPTLTDFQPTTTVGVPTKTLIATLAATLPAGEGTACIPNNKTQTAKVVEIIDGNTVRVLLNGLVYTVRYIGVAIPVNPIYAQAATYNNGKLVFSREVTLIPEATDKDAAGRLLRYVKAGNTFANLEIIKQGMGAASDTPPNSSCAQVFAGAEQEARQAKTGQWSTAPSP